VRRRAAQAYLHEHGGILYSLDGLSELFQRHKIKRRQADRSIAGLMSPRRRRSKNRFAAALAARGALWPEGVAPSALVSDSARPPWLDDDRDQWRWLCAAVEPTTGDAVALSLSRTAPLVCKPFSMPSGGAVRRMPAGRSPLVLDGSGNHTGAQVRWPGGLQRSRLPPLSPKLKSGRALV